MSKGAASNSIRLFELFRIGFGFGYWSRKRAVAFSLKARRYRRGCDIWSRWCAPDIRNLEFGCHILPLTDADDWAIVVASMSEVKVGLLL